MSWQADKNGEPDSIEPALVRLALGWAYILLHQALYTLLVPDEYFYSQAFQVRSRVWMGWDGWGSRVRDGK